MSNRVPSAVLRPLSIGLPLATLALSLGLLLPRYLTLQEDERQATKLRDLVAQRQRSMEAIQAGRTETIIARVPASRDEPVVFLRNLNTVANLSQVRIKELKEAAPPDNSLLVAQSTDGPAKATDNNGLPPGTAQNSLNVTVEGNYHSVIRFFAELETYQRLISLSNVNIHVDKSSLLTVQMQLTRYTGPAEGAKPGVQSSFASAQPLPTEANLTQPASLKSPGTSQ